MLIPSYRVSGIRVSDLQEKIDDLKSKLADLQGELEYLIRSELAELRTQFLESISGFMDKKVNVTLTEPSTGGNYVVEGTLNRVMCTPMTNLEKLCIELVIDGTTYGTYGSFEIKEL